MGIDLLERSTSLQEADAGRLDDLTVEVTSDLDDALRAYRELEVACIATAFQTRLWVECWLTRLARPRGARPLFCTLRNREGAAVLLLPLCLRTDGYLRVIEGADLGVSDYMAPVMALSFEPAPAQWAVIWRRIVAALPPHDLLRLSKIPLDVAGRPNPLAWIAGARKLELQAHGTAVSTPWDDCMKRIFSRNRREKLSKGWRRLAQQGEVRFRVVGEAGEMDPLFDQLLALRFQRFEALKRAEPFRDSDFVGFYKGLIERGAASGFARLAVLEVDEHVMAMQFGVCHAGAFHLLVSAFVDQGWTQLAPGMLLAARMMQWAAEEGMGYYDFTIGNEDYKGRLGARSRDMMEVVSAGSWRGIPAVATSRLKQKIKRQPWLLATIAKAQGLRWSRSG